jgi:hypothetical protein
MVFPIIVFLNAFSAVFLVCFSFFILLSYIYLCKKRDGKIILMSVILYLAVAFGWMGITLTSLSVLFYGNNLPGLKAIVPYFSYTTVPIGALAIIYTTWELAGSPKNKKYILITYAIYSAFYYITLFVTFNQAVMISDTGVIYDDWISPSSFFYYVLWGIIVISVIITGIGFNKFRQNTPGELHSRSIALLLATPLVGISILLDTVIFMEAQVFLLFIPRFLMILGEYLIFYGFRPMKV